MRVLIVLWNDLVNKLKISEIKYDSSKKGKRIAVYVATFFFCLLIVGGAYVNAKIIVNNTEHGTLFAPIIKVILLTFLIISSLFSVRYILYSEAGISRIAPLPLSKMEMMNIRTIETVIKNALLSLIFCFPFSIVIFEKPTDIVSFIISGAFIIPISAYNVAHAIFLLPNRIKGLKGGARLLIVLSLIVNVLAMYKMLVSESNKIVTIVAITALLMATNWFLLFLVHQHFFSIIEKNQKKSKVYRDSTKKFDLEQALFYKEMRMFTSDKLFIVNSSFGAFMLVVVAVLIVTLPINSIFKDDGVKVSYVYNSIPIIFSLIISTCCTTYCTFSLEGKNMWIYQNLPVTILQIVKAKVRVNLMISIPVIILSACIAIIKTSQLSIIVLIMSFLLPIIISVFVALLGCFIDMRMCNLEWENAQNLIKQTKTYPLTLLGGMYLAGLSEVGIIFLYSKMNIYILYCMILGLYLLALGVVLLGIKIMSGKFRYGEK